MNVTGTTSKQYSKINKKTQLEKHWVIIVHMY